MRLRALICAAVLAAVLAPAAHAGEASLDVYFLQGEQLVAVGRPGETLEDALEALVAGPSTTELDEGLHTRTGLEQVPASIDDLRVLQLCTQDRTTASDLIRNRIRPEVPAKRFARLAVLFGELQAGACDAAILDVPILGAERAQLPFRYGPLAGIIPTGEEYGIVLPRGSSLREPLDAALATLFGDGTIERLSTTWLSTDLAELPVLG